jgi:hypothetical protein
MTTAIEMGAEATDWPAGLDQAPEGMAEVEVRRLAETFAVTPDAVRQAVARVGTGFRDVQRELGGRR